jgi:hypothetical protein
MIACPAIPVLTDGPLPSRLPSISTGWRQSRGWCSILTFHVVIEYSASNLDIAHGFLSLFMA